jgi:MFS family permease
MRVFTRPRLWGLLVAASLCGLLDELVVALSALHLSREFALGDALKAASLSVFSLGSLLGAGMVERLTRRFSSRAILSVSAAGALLFLVGLACERSPFGANCALFCLGIAAAAHYPLLQAAAYDSAPGRPGLVNAGTQLLVPLDIALPLLVGLVAERAGLPLALLSLAVQPLGVALAAFALLRDERRGH